MEISELKKKIKKQQKQLDYLCKAAGNEHLCSDYVSNEAKEDLIHLKKNGKEVQAVKKLREMTGMDLADAKKFVDEL